MITPSDSKAIVPSLDKARQAGLLVIALDTQIEPADAADATFATDNYAAGLRSASGRRAKFEKEGKQAKIAMLDLNPDGVSVDVQRDQGFLEGFGVDVGDKTKIGDESDPRIVGHDVTDGAEEGGRTAMENLLQKDPDDQPRLHDQRARRGRRVRGAEGRRQGEGRHDRLRRRRLPGRGERQERRDRRDLAAVPAEDGRDGRAGRSTAFAKDGTKPEPTAGKDFVDTGVTLITDKPADGVESKDTAFGLENCWG